MFFLLLAILGSASLPVLFRAFDDWRVNVFWAIPANYLTCVFVGTVWGGHGLDVWEMPYESWAPLALLQGIILAVNFFLIAHTAQRVGVSVAALASRLSVAIPAVLAFLIYGDSVTFPKMFGLLGALLSLYLCTAPDVRSSAKVSFSTKMLPLLVFFTFGCYFTIIKYAQAYYLDASSYHSYVMSGFFFAFLTSLLIGLAKRVLSTVDFRVRHLTGGVLLGVINYAAVYALLRVLALDGWESSKVYPIYSVGVVALSTLMALIFFREQLSRKKTVGLLVGLLAVAMLNR
ncbi:MAG: EamA family transporter [Deltaproteobacteria bacterium]|nr:EamA family transporter [Deltaproteobacteria bacterium]